MTHQLYLQNTMLPPSTPSTATPSIYEPRTMSSNYQSNTVIIKSGSNSPTATMRVKIEAETKPGFNLHDKTWVKGSSDQLDMNNQEPDSNADGYNTMIFLHPAFSTMKLGSTTLYLHSHVFLLANTSGNSAIHEIPFTQLQKPKIDQLATATTSSIIQTVKRDMINKRMSILTQNIQDQDTSSTVR